MQVMKVVEKRTNVLFTVSYEESKYRAIQLVDHAGNRLQAHSDIKVDDLVLVAEVGALLYSPSMTDAADSVSHFIVGIVPPSRVQVLSPDLVRGV